MESRQEGAEAEDESVPRREPVSQSGQDDSARNVPGGAGGDDGGHEGFVVSEGQQQHRLEGEEGGVGHVRHADAQGHAEELRPLQYAEVKADEDPPKALAGKNHKNTKFL